MFFDAKIFVIFIFIAINSLILFAIRTRTTIVTSLIIAHLIAVLFFSLSISNYNSFKEIVLALIIYSMVVLFLISNYNPIHLVGNEDLNIGRPKLFWFAVFVIFVTVFLALFFISKNLTEISEIVLDKRIHNQKEQFLNPINAASHPVHAAVKKVYFSKKFNEDWLSGNHKVSEMSDYKKARLRNKLSDNFLLKRSSDVILIIVAISTSLLILSTKKPKNNL
jgi:hypothetical protein